MNFIISMSKYNTKLLSTGPDSLVYEIEAEDVSENFFLLVHVLFIKKNNEI